MQHFPITETVEEALNQVGRSRRDDLGYLYHTFRIRLPDANTESHAILSKLVTFRIRPPDTNIESHAVLSKLVDAGWQLQGIPIVLEATKAAPRHVLISMLHAEPRPLQIRGDLRISGSIEGRGDLHGQWGS